MMATHLVVASTLRVVDREVSSPRIDPLSTAAFLTPNAFAAVRQDEESALGRLANL
jgi:hypothetical protein